MLFNFRGRFVTIQAMILTALKPNSRLPKLIEGSYKLRSGPSDCASNFVT